MNQPLIVRSKYVPGKEALIVHVDMSAYLIDYYLHRKKVAPLTSPEQDERLKDLLACLAIHLTTRSAAQAHAWTLHTFAEPPYSLFGTGAVTAVHENREADGYLVGNVLRDYISHTDVNSLHTQFTDKDGNSFKSYVQTELTDVDRIVEYFYSQSEQQPLRIHLSRTSDQAIGMAALPDFEPEWFGSARLEDFLNDPSIVQDPMFLWRLEFRCDCSPQKLIPFFRAISKESVADLYGNDDSITIACPRCGEQFSILRTDLDEPTPAE